MLARRAPLLQMLDFDFFELLDAVTIARSRIEAFYDMSDVASAASACLDPRAASDLADVPAFDETQL